MGTMLQVIMLGQFIEGVVLDAPPSVPYLPDDLSRIRIEFLADQPAPRTVLVLDEFVGPHPLSLWPPFLGQDHAHGSNRLVSKRQIPGFPQFDFSIPPLIALGWLVLGQGGGFLVNFI